MCWIWKNRKGLKDMPVYMSRRFTAIIISSGNDPTRPEISPIGRGATISAQIRQRVLMMRKKKPENRCKLGDLFVSFLLTI